MSRASSSWSRSASKRSIRDLATDPHLSGSQIRRFLVLHKELDADDGELTRTRKVRRKFVAERLCRADRHALLRS